MCTLINCRSVFRAAGNIAFKKCKINESLVFDPEKCCEIRKYELLYIQNLVKNEIQLASNQLII